MIVEERGISRAARKLGISQPALSKNLRKLEESLGTKLFERSASGVELTASGDILMERAQVIGLEYQYALHEIGNLLSQQDATMRIGAGPVWSSTILPLVTPRFHKLFPNHRLQVETGRPEDLCEDLRLGRIDILASAIIPETRMPGFRAVPLLRSELTILASPSHPLMRKGAPIALTDVSDYPFVAFQPARSISSILSSFLKANGAEPPRVLLETSSLYACAELVRSGEYLFFESRMIAESAIGQGLTALPLEKVIARFDMGIIYRDGLERIPHYRRLMSLIDSVIQQRMASSEDGHNQNVWMRPE